MKADFINPFIMASTEVLNQETGRRLRIEKGPLVVLDSPYTSMDITVMIGVTGDVMGIIMYGMSERTAKNIVSEMMGQPVPVMDKMVESAIAELGNVITGIASKGLEQAGFPCTLTPPSLVVGRGALISTVNIKRIRIPMETEIGDMEISVALKEFQGCGSP